MQAHYTFQGQQDKLLHWKGQCMANYKLSYNPIQVYAESILLLGCNELQNFISHCQAKIQSGMGDRVVLVIATNKLMNAWCS